MVFGESINDSKSLKELFLALRPDLPRVSPQQRPIILRRKTENAKVLAQTEMIKSLVAVAQVRSRVIAVVAHRDLDGLETNDVEHLPSASEAELTSSLTPIRNLGIAVVATVPAWEIEAWWLMWPDQVAKHRSCWRKLPDRTGKRVDLITDAKKKLKADLKPPAGKRCPEYSETDSSLIAAKIREDDVVRQPAGRSLAFERFVANVDAIDDGTDHKPASLE